MSYSDSLIIVTLMSLVKCFFISMNKYFSEDPALIFASNLRSLRLSHGYTQARLAKITDLSPRQIIRYEQGVSEPTLTALIAIANVFNVSVDYLCGRNL